MLVVALALAIVTAGCRAEGAEDVQVWWVNATRDGQGLNMLWRRNYLADRALAHSFKMCEAGRIYHSNLAQQYGGEPWTGLGENVGYSGVTNGDTENASKRIFDAFMASPAHRDNIVGSWKDLGVGAVYCEKNKYLYVTQAFRR